MERPSRPAFGEFLAATLLFAIVSLVSWHFQKIRLIRYWDSDEYYWMTYNFATGQPIRASAPWVYRVGVPWLASIPSRFLLRGGYPYYTLAYPYYAINAAAALATVWLLIVWLRRFVESPAVRLVVVALFVAAWHGPVRFLYFYPMYVDPPFILFLLVGLLLIDLTRERPIAYAALLLTVVAVAGTLCRESMILIPLTFIVARSPWASPGRAARSFGDTVCLLVPLAAALLTLQFTHRITAPKASYSTVDGVLTVVRQKPVFTWVLAWFITFGPAVVAVIGFDWRRAVDWLRDRPELAFYMTACGVVGFIGGTDTERLLFWALPVVYVLTARAMERHQAVLSGGALAAMLVLSQVVSARLLWPIPDVLTSPTALRDVPSLGGRIYAALNRVIVMDDYYWNLWSFFGSRPWHAALLVYDVLFVALLLFLMRQRSVSTPRPAASPAGMS
jgi:hypothetical protein